MSRDFVWLLITADPQIAAYAETSGVQRIFLDMETRGKEERQGHLDTHRAHHTYAQIVAVREALTSSEVLVRLNPLWVGTATEVTSAIDHGAQRLMLPMFTTAEEVRTFRQLTPDHVPVTYLAETPQALVRIRDWLPEINDGDDVHFGLNDLSLAMGLDFLFEPLAGGLFTSAAALLRSSRISFGIGGVARTEGGELPAEYILGEHVRLGSTRAILSRAFHGQAASVEELRGQIDLPSEVSKLDGLVNRWRQADASELDQNQEAIARATFTLARARSANA